MITLSLRQVRYALTVRMAYKRAGLFYDGICAMSDESIKFLGA